MGNRSDTGSSPSAGHAVRRKFWLFIALLASIAIAIVSRFALTPPAEEELSENPSSPVLFEAGFDGPGGLKGWREHAFNGKSTYRIEKDPAGNYALHASSRDSFSALFRIVSIPLAVRPRLEWEWKVDRAPAHRNEGPLEASGENDFALRICAVFGNNNPFRTDIIQYIWDERFPAETFSKSPYEGNVRMVVVRGKGPGDGKGYIKESRDLYADYEKFFGGKRSFGRLRAIAVMANSDDAHSSTDAWLKGVRVESPPEAASSSRPPRGIRGALRLAGQALKKGVHAAALPGLFHRRRAASPPAGAEKRS